MNGHPRRPLVIAATARATEQAQRLGVDRPIENAVLDALLERGVKPVAEGTLSRVFIDDRRVAIIQRKRSPTSDRLGWVVLEVEAA